MFFFLKKTKTKTSHSSGEFIFLYLNTLNLKFNLVIRHSLRYFALSRPRESKNHSYQLLHISVLFCSMDGYFVVYSRDLKEDVEFLS